MTIYNNYSLKKHNTFGLDIVAKEFFSAQSEDEIVELIKSRDLINEENLILGGGSNILFKGNYNGIVINSNLSNINIIEDHKDSVLIEAESGVDWDHLVDYSVENGFYGIENLSYIPGTVGAAPIQNIGAYGVELENVFVELEAIDLKSGEMKLLGKKECQFKYRDSIFKNSLKNKFYISKIRLRLQKNGQLKLNYRAVQDFIKEKSIEISELDLRKVRDIIINIRKSKLPDPHEIGNAGSFFKNPVINNNLFIRLKEKYKDLVFFKLSKDEIKIPAAWLIEKAGFKGKRFGEVGIHDKQALVIVNYGNAESTEIINLSEKIKNKIFEKFNIDLETEVNIV